MNKFLIIAVLILSGCGIPQRVNERAETLTTVKIDSLLLARDKIDAEIDVTKQYLEDKLVKTQQDIDRLSADD